MTTDASAATCSVTGSVVALVTPMAANGDIEWDALKQLVEWHVTSGTDAIVAVGTTGESATVDFDEHEQLLEFIIKAVDRRVPVIAGTGANSTREAIHLTQSAYQLGADACLLVTPYYNKPTQEGLYQHHKAIADAVPLPQWLYNVPGRTACDMLPETVARLAELETVVAIKEATGDIERGRQILDLCGDRIALFSGDDGSFLDLMAIGAQGNISVTANVAPEQMHVICQLANEGKLDEARQLNRPLEALHRDLFIESNPIPVKWALHHLGRIGPGIRLPLTPLSEAARPRVLAALVEAGLCEG